MNKLRILKINISSTVILSFAMFICLLCSMLMLPIGINYLNSNENNKDLDFYLEELADYCLINFPNDYYKYLETKFDMENFAGITLVGDFYDEKSNNYLIKIVSEKMVNELPSLGYNFSKTISEDYKEAYAPVNLSYVYKIGDVLEVSCGKGIYEYRKKIKIIGFTDKEYYDLSYYNSRLGKLAKTFLIYDEIPPYAKVNGGLMISKHTAEYYQNMGAKTRTLRELSESKKVSHSDYSVIYWSSSLLILLTIALAANYYFSVDKMTKRSGIMTIYGAKRSNIVVTELIKLILIFVMAFILSALFTAIMLFATSDTTTIKSYFIGLGITFAIYVVSVSFGFIKFARFDPLKSISNNNLE